MRRFEGFLFGGRSSSLPSLGSVAQTGSGGSHVQDWGQIVTPDEIRLAVFPGNSRLVCQDGTQITDDMIAGIRDHVVMLVSDQLGHDIYPTLYRHRPEKVTGDRADGLKKEPWARWHDAYNAPNTAGMNRPHRVVFRRRPLIRLLKWQYVEPWHDRIIFDLMKSNPEIQYGAGIMTATWYSGTFASGRYHALPVRAAHVYRGIPGSARIHNAYYVDYVGGYESSYDVPRELCDLIIKLCAIMIMSAYGDGLAAALASFTFNLGTIHESVGTTQSSTSGMFGARILQLWKEIQDWWKRHASRYRPKRIGTL